MKHYFLHSSIIFNMYVEIFILPLGEDAARRRRASVLFSFQQKALQMLVFF